jgi:glycogen operon protein
MFVAGDEHRRTQNGNNNAYCHDDEISWVNWELADRNKDMVRFFREMIAFRARNPVLHNAEFFDGRRNSRGLADITWHGVRLHAPEWGNPDARTLAFTLGEEDDGNDVHVMLNAGWTDEEFELPVIEGRGWFRAVDTAQLSPNDISSEGAERPVQDKTYRVEQRSVVVLVSKQQRG